MTGNKTFTPTQVLELQHEQFAFSQSREGLVFWESFARTGKQTGASWQQAEARTLQTAPTYFVSPAMYDLALHAAWSMPDVPMAATDLPSLGGFCLFANPSIAPDVHGKMVSIAGFSWHIAQDHEGNKGVMWISYSDTHDDRDEYYDQMIIGQNSPRLLPLAYNFEDFESQTLSLDEIVAQHGGTRETVNEALVHMRKLPLCLFALMNQTIVTTTLDRPQRPARRRLKHAGSPLHDKMIKIVRLRRITPKTRSGGAQPVDWSHRWVVNGYWRMQPTNAGVKRIWIMPFIKGPDDKPLRLKETVNVLDR